MSTPPKQIKVLVTGFGPFLDITTNPSWEIARQLPTSIESHACETIIIVTPTAPTPAAYHKIFSQIPTLIEQHTPDLIVHMGLDVDSSPGVFKLERSAPKEGYHDIPDIDRKVFTRAENKKTFGKSAASLVTTIDVDSAVEVWQTACSSLNPSNIHIAKGKSKGKSNSMQMIDVRLSDDVGTYVCGFQYYVGMLEMQKQTGKRNVVFLHVPRVETEEEVRIGIRVAEELIRALVGVLGSGCV
ncbi:peptidase C15, pyroglutamyl peptidase I-like protein [Ophiobolus disseminans]|uniref:Peptidase C15, pyroglutamyl peptidase I-like protein n=1 Tax=Ophiobolus disseminans TaxID=1469910 RepID=A0A6A7AIN0_9PLEO|nr:peptidase C15, pyroglutamyl peptidase I-like protein [Ophiobolus disseminans]